MKNKPQISLFPNTHCVVCGVEVKNNVVTCDKCTDDWTNKNAKINKNGR